MRPAFAQSPPEVRQLASGLAFPEGPAFAPDGALWGVELQGGSLFRLAGEALERFPVGGAPNGLAFRRGEAWFCDSGLRAIRVRSPDGALRSVITAIGGSPPDKPNDLAFDPAGTLVFTCPGDSRTEPTGTVWCRTADGAVKQVAGGLRFPNGLAFSPDGRSLYIAETYRQRIWRGDWDGIAHCWRSPEPWGAVAGPIGPDGMAFGLDGRLHVAVFGQGHVAVLGADGVQVARLDLPAARPTNVAFDPSGELGLVVTEAETGVLLSLPALGPGAPLFSGGEADALS